MLLHNGRVSNTSLQRDDSKRWSFPEGDLFGWILVFFVRHNWIDLPQLGCTQWGFFDKQTDTWHSWAWRKLSVGVGTFSDDFRLTPKILANMFSRDLGIQALYQPVLGYEKSEICLYRISFEVALCDCNGLETLFTSDRLDCRLCLSPATRI